MNKSIWREPRRPVSWRNAIRALQLYDEQGNIPAPVVRISLECAARAFYGSYWRAAFALARAALRSHLIYAEVEVRTRWYRIRRLSEHEIEQRWRA